MLSTNETMSSIVRRIQFTAKAHQDIFEVERTHDKLILGASCMEFDRISLARSLISQIKKMRLANKPHCIDFNLNCDISECRVVCTWKL